MLQYDVMSLTAVRLLNRIHSAQQDYAHAVYRHTSTSLHFTLYHVVVKYLDRVRV